MRGLGMPVVESDTIDEVMKRNGLDWRVVELPVALAGKRETRLSTRHKALVRSDNGVELDITSNDYQPFQNRDCLGTFFHAAEAMGGKVVSTAVIDDGRSITATVSLGSVKNVGADWYGKREKKYGDANVGDSVGLTAIISTGHEVGRAFKIRGSALRLACLNGLTVNGTAMNSVISISHNKRWTSNETRRVANAVEGYVKGFEAFMEKAEVLRSANITHEIYKAYFLELFNPEHLEEMRRGAEVACGTQYVGGVRNQAAVGAVVLENILADTDTYFAKMGRTAKRVNDLVRTQPGHELSGSTMWDALNAVTYYTDHERGRDDGAAVLSAIMGDGDRLKSRALDLAIDYTQRLGAR
jgi:phage/plasmid-like protein (TIGR03299 family)